MENSITQVEHDALWAELETASLERSREIIIYLLGKLTVYGYDVYKSDFGDDRLCECGHPYYRHFDTYADMDPVGCKYCHCDVFVEQGDWKKWKALNSEVV